MTMSTNIEKLETEIKRDFAKCKSVENANRLHSYYCGYLNAMLDYEMISADLHEMLADVIEECRLSVAKKL